MSCLTLFLTFLKIGAVSFGGGYGILSLVRETALAYGWLTEEELLNFIAVSESTPGPIAVNMATFVGASQCGFPGALCATLGIVLPSFVVILIIAALVKNLIRYAGVRATLDGIRPAIAGMILGTFTVMFLSGVFGFEGVGSGVSFDWKSLLLFSALCAVAFLYRKLRKKSLSPILLILLSGAAGLFLFGV